jgi:hypothetical protein
MTEWLDAIKTALPVVMALALMIWMAIVYHGDSRWLRRQEAIDNTGDVRWAPKNVVATVLGQNDSIAAHENRIDRLEEREETVLKDIRAHLESLSVKMDDVGERVIRLEERAKDRRHSD